MGEFIHGVRKREEVSKKQDLPSARVASSATTHSIGTGPESTTTTTSSTAEASTSTASATSTTTAVSGHLFDSWVDDTVGLFEEMQDLPGELAVVSGHVGVCGT